MIRAAMLSLALLCAPAASQAVPLPPSLVDYGGFAALTSDLAATRTAHLVSLDRFWTMAGEAPTLILDARSADAFQRGHIDGAVNLPFTDFTAASLAHVIGDPNRRVLIYCNNNFINNADPVMTKQPRLALNVQTFINLHGYGFANVYELADAVDFNDPRVRWVRGPQSS